MKIAFQPLQAITISDQCLTLAGTGHFAILDGSRVGWGGGGGRVQHLHRVSKPSVIELSEENVGFLSMITRDW